VVTKLCIHLASVSLSTSTRYSIIVLFYVTREFDSFQNQNTAIVSYKK